MVFQFLSTASHIVVTNVKVNLMGETECGAMLCWSHSYLKSVFNQLWIRLNDSFSVSVFVERKTCCSVAQHLATCNGRRECTLVPVFICLSSFTEHACLIVYARTHTHTFRESTQTQRAESLESAAISLLYVVYCSFLFFFLHLQLLSAFQFFLVQSRSASLAWHFNLNHKPKCVLYQKKEDLSMLIDHTVVATYVVQGVVQCTVKIRIETMLLFPFSLFLFQCDDWCVWGCVSLPYIITHFLLNPKSKKSECLCVAGWMGESERASAILGWLGKSWLPSVWEKCSWQVLNWGILLCCSLETHTHNLVFVT